MDDTEAEVRALELPITKFLHTGGVRPPRKSERMAPILCPHLAPKVESRHWFMQQKNLENENNYNLLQHEQEIKGNDTVTLHFDECNN